MRTTAKGDFGQGSIAGNILRLGLPLTVAQLTVVLYNVVDRAFIGHIPGEGDLAITGIGIVLPITSLITAFSQLCGQGGGPLCAMARGAGDNRRATRIMGNALTMLLAFAALLMAVFYTFHEPILFAFGASEATIGYATDYLLIYLLGTAFTMISLGMNPFINGQGFSGVGMMTVLLGAVANLILDPVFIFGLDMGIEGAAIATVISQAASAFWVIRFLTGKKTLLLLTREAMVPDFALVRRIASLGLTGFTFQMTNSVVQALSNNLLFTYGAALGGSAVGDLYVGAMTIIHSVREVIFKPVQGMTQGAQAVISFNYGARKYSRVRQSIRFLNVVCPVYNFAVWMLVLAAPVFFIHIFNDKPELVATTIPCMRIYYACYGFMAFQQIGQNGFVALGRSRWAVFFSLFRKVFLVVPLMLLLPRLWDFGVFGIFLAEPISDLLGGMACWGTMMLLVYRKLKLEDGAPSPWEKA